YDLAPDLLRGIDPRVQTAVFDISNPGSLPDVDAVIIAGVIQYVFDDDVVDRLFAHLQAPVTWVRSTCTLKREAEHVVNQRYASNYRTIAGTCALLSRYHDVTAIDRIYPDEIESAFGTKQFYFELRRRMV